MRHLIIAALSAVVALPITIAAPRSAPELYALGITAAFGAGVFAGRSKSSEKRVNEHLELIRKQLNKLAGVSDSLVTGLALLRALVEGWKGRCEATLESYDRRLATLENLRREVA